MSGWVTLDQPEFDFYVHSDPPRPLRVRESIAQQVRADLRSLDAAWVPLLGTLALVAGAVRGNLGSVTIGIALWAFYVEGIRAWIRRRRLSQVRFGRVSHPQERAFPAGTLFVATAEFDDGRSIKVLLDDRLLALLPPLEGRPVEVAAVGMPGAKALVVIGARMPPAAA